MAPQTQRCSIYAIDKSKDVLALHGQFRAKNGQKSRQSNHEPKTVSARATLTTRTVRNITLRHFMVPWCFGNPSTADFVPQCPNQFG
jgi:hypothetical protein